MRFEVFRDRNFTLYTAGNLVSWVGTWMQRTGVGWLSWELTHSPSWVGIIALALSLPLIFFNPVFGVILDRTDRKRYMIAVQVVLSLLGFAFVVLYETGLLNIHVLLATCLLQGVANSAYQSARLALVNDIAPRNLLSQAIGTNSIIYNSTRLVGPALAGVVIVAWGVGATFLCNAISYVASLASLFAITIRRRHAAKEPTGIFSEFVEGLRYTVEHPRIRMLLLLAIFVSVQVRGIIELLPAFAGGVFQQGSSGLATLMAAGGAGAVAGGFVLSHTADEDRLLTIVRLSCLFSGVVVALFALVNYYPVAVLLCAVTGLGVNLASVGLQTVLQMTISDEFRGRVVAFWGITTVAGPAIGGAVIGGAAQAIGLMPASVISGGLCAVFCWVVIRRSRLFTVAPAKPD